MITRLKVLVAFMHTEAEQGNQAFVDNINEGHHLAYLSDITYLKDNETYITKVLLSDE